MARSWLLLAALALSVLSAALAATTTPVVDFRRQLVAAINAKRADKGLAALCVNRCVSRVILKAELASGPSSS